MSLGLHIDTGDTVDPMHADDWAVTPPGTEFVRHAASGWADAGVADGDDPEVAREAAGRTVTFYTVPADEW